MLARAAFSGPTNATLIETGTESYRLARSKANNQQDQVITCRGGQELTCLVTGLGPGCQPVSADQCSAAVINTSVAGALICP